MSEKYEWGALLGAGGMGSVYEGRHRVTGRRVALKKLAPELTKHPEAVKRFLREARAAAAIEHLNVVQIFDFGTDEGVPFLVMERLSGGTLGGLLEAEGPVSPRRIVELIAPVLSALEKAHELGVVHRDLKPDNIFLAESAELGVVPKLLDFGIARFHEAQDEHGPLLTRTGVVVGTPMFMSPEQARGLKNVDERTDIYSVGVILYFAVSNHYPHEHSSYNALVVAIAQDEPTPLASLRPDLPSDFVAVVERAMAKRREDRFASAKALRLALDASIGDEGTDEPMVATGLVQSPSEQASLRPSSRPSHSDTAFARTLESTGSRASSPRPARRWVWLALAALLALAGIGGVAFRFRSVPPDGPGDVDTSSGPSEPLSATPSETDESASELVNGVDPPPDPPQAVHEPEAPATPEPSGRAERGRPERSEPALQAPPIEEPASPDTPATEHRSGDLDPSEFFE